MAKADRKRAAEIIKGVGKEIARRNAGGAPAGAEQSAREKAADIVSQVCRTVANRIDTGAPVPQGILHVADKQATLISYLDAITVEGQTYSVLIRPRVREFPDCAAAEIHLGGALLHWIEREDRWEGYRAPESNVRVAIVRKAPPARPKRS